MRSAIFAAATSLSCATAVALSAISADAKAPPARCNEFSDTICFALGGGASRSHKVIIDFTIDEIQFGDGGHVTIYQGIGLSEQEDAGTITKEKSYDVSLGTVTVYAGSKKPGRYFDIHYAARQGWGKVQIFGYLKDAKTTAELASFIAAIHPCKSAQLSVSCTADAPLAEAAAFLRTLAG